MAAAVNANAPNQSGALSMNGNPVADGFAQFFMHDHVSVKNLAKMVSLQLYPNMYDDTRTTTRVMSRFITDQQQQHIEIVSPYVLNNHEFYPYVLDEQYNPEVQKRPRYFPALSQFPDGSFFHEHPVIQQLNEMLIGISDEAPKYYFDHQVIGYHPTPFQSSATTPNLAHHDDLDGYTHSSILTLERANVEGAAFFVASGDVVNTDVEQVPSGHIHFLQEIPVAQGVVINERKRGNQQPLCHGAQPTRLRNRSKVGSRIILATEITPIW